VCRCCRWLSVVGIREDVKTPPSTRPQHRWCTSPMLRLQLTPLHQVLRPLCCLPQLTISQDLSCSLKPLMPPLLPRLLYLPATSRPCSVPLCLTLSTCQLATSHHSRPVTSLVMVVVAQTAVVSLRASHRSPPVASLVVVVVVVRNVIVTSTQRHRQLIRNGMNTTYPTMNHHSCLMTHPMTSHTISEVN